MRVGLSFRKEPNPDDIAVVDGIRTYKIAALFEQKLKAATDRTKARDLFDLGYVAGTFGDELPTGHIQRAERFSRDYEGLAGRYASAFEEDKLLKGLTTADDRVLEFRIAILEQMYRRGLSVVTRSVPNARSLAEVLAHHKIWLGSDGREGSRADRRKQELRRPGTVRRGFRESRPAADRLHRCGSPARQSPGDQFARCGV